MVTLASQPLRETESYGHSSGGNGAQPVVVQLDLTHQHRRAAQSHTVCSSQTTVHLPPGTSIVHGCPSGPTPSLIAAATTAAHRPVPHERVSPTPRSCT